MPDLKHGLEGVKLLLPVLENSLKKGDCGRMLIVGGSKDYTGAPYFAAISSLKLGADLAHVFTAPEAVTVIKGYSPELIVHSAMTDVFTQLARSSALIVGPGLGRDERLKKFFTDLLHEAKTARIPTVIDADGLWLLQQCAWDELSLPDSTFITPNHNELKWLARKINPDSTDIRFDAKIAASALSLALPVHVFVKDAVDLHAFDGTVEEGESHTGSPRRPGGIGDVLSGVLANFLYWAHRSEELKNAHLCESQAFLAASAFVKECSVRAFRSEGRSMLATDVIDQIKHVVHEIDHLEALLSKQ